LAIKEFNMSEEAVRAHIARLVTDSEYRRTINDISNLEERKAFQKGEGFDFEGNEVGPALAEKTDKELEAAGGGTCRIRDAAACGSDWERKTLECSAINGGGTCCCR
jgi:predicted ribosomally synthesized peptide with nif11-like leader